MIILFKNWFLHPSLKININKELFSYELLKLYYQSKVHSFFYDFYNMCRYKNEGTNN